MTNAGRVESTLEQEIEEERKLLRALVETSSGRKTRRKNKSSPGKLTITANSTQVYFQLVMKVKSLERRPINFLQGGS